MVGLFADPHMIEYLGLGRSSSVAGAGLFYGHPKQLAIQAGAAATIIVWDGLITFVILRVLGLFMKLRLPEAALETGDVAIHGEEAYPASELVSIGVRAVSVPAHSAAHSAAHSGAHSAAQRPNPRPRPRGPPRNPKAGAPNPRPRPRNPTRNPLNPRPRSGALRR